MARYQLADGSFIGDEEIEKEAKEYEEGTWAGKLEKIHVGRPPLSNEKLITVSVNFPKSMLAEIDSRAKNRSDYIRKAVSAALRS